MIAGIGQKEFWLMILYETIFFVEMAINFIKQDLDDEGVTKYELPEKIAVRYIQSTFLVDLIALIPWGYIFE